MKIILLGPPGAGKGTQAKDLSQRLNLPHISTGDILRQNVSLSTELGKKAKDFMDRGLLVPDELITEMLKERLQQPDVQEEGFILDGYPRNLNQAQTLDNILKKKNTEIDIVFYLDTSESVIIQRLSGRLVCSKCGANFHIKNMPPKVDMICDYCQGELYQRTDDREETIKKRLQVYYKEVSSLIKYYERQNKLQRICADEEREIVLSRIIQMVKNHCLTTKT
ncbi:MAG: adenylate kinase [Candidatus Omnitrophica bacterium]|nr:adenylate kinase [Candidatus Omnitrophota bacterium]